MAIKYAILGYLSWQPLTGYDLKQIFRDSITIYWSGNNNQIYRTLVKLHEAGYLTRETEDPDVGPARKVYSITAAGEAHLRAWLTSSPELPDIKHPLLIQLAWSDQLSSEEIDTLLVQYEEEVNLKLAMLREHTRRNSVKQPNRTVRETLLWQRISANWIATYEQQLSWVQTLRNDLHDL